MKTNEFTQKWTNAKVGIVGGTGSFGKKFLDYILQSDINEIRIISRDEFKQEEMRTVYTDDRIRYRISDVRDYESLQSSFRGLNYLFHAAALKQVPSCENHPLEATKTNILGSNNVLKAAAENCLESIVVLSTDKAVYPINTMGISKAMMEKIAINSDHRNLKVNVTRYGNVLLSRGSVIPFFLKRISEGLHLPITDTRMTRFLMPLEWSVSLVEKAMFGEMDKSLYVRKAPAANIITIAEALFEISGRNTGYKEVGIRPGEKLHESLLSEEEMSKASEDADYYTVSLARTPSRDKLKAYTSNSSDLLNKSETIQLISRQPEFTQLFEQLF